MLKDYYSEKKEYVKVSGGRLRGIFELLGDCRDKKILDIGCGEGLLGKAVKARFGTAEVCGLDISPAAVEKARLVLDGAECLDLESEGALEKALSSAEYDFIIISEVLEHLFHPEKVLRSIRSRSPRSVVIITVPNILFWKNRLKMFFGSFEYTSHGLMDRGHIHFFSWKSFRNMIHGEKYEIKAESHHLPTRILRPFGRAFPGLAAYQFVVALTSPGASQAGGQNSRNRQNI